MSNSYQENQAKVVGILALQGAFAEHKDHLNRAANDLNSNFSFPEVRTQEDLSRCDGLIIPGGESTTMSLIAERTEMLEPLRRFVTDPTKPVWGTCAGLIFLGSSLKNGRVDQKQLAGLNIEVTRNAFGRQLHSFTTNLDFSGFAPGVTSFEATFIRAPAVSAVGAGVKVLYKLGDPELIVAVREGSKLGTSFHPELSPDCSFHKWFLEEFCLVK